MKCVVTILQNKRIAMPYIFGKYCLPMMRTKFKGEVKLFHIHHDIHVPSSFLQSCRTLGEQELVKTRQFIDKGAYRYAHVIRHRNINKELILIPSIMQALDIAEREHADFHLWLEDDALIYDTDCDKWQTLLGAGDTGLYRNTNHKKMINAAYYLSTPEFNKRVRKMMVEYKKEPYEKYVSHGTQYEHVLWRASRKPVLMNTMYAIRHHPYKGEFQVTGTDLKKYLKQLIPNILDEDLALLKKDFDD